MSIVLIIILSGIYIVSGLYVYKVYTEQLDVFTRMDRKVELGARWFFVLCPFVNTMLALVMLTDL